MHQRSRFPHYTKGIALVMVFVWTFALMISLANACIVSGNAHAASFGHLHAAGHDSDVRILGVGSDQDHEPEPVKATCKDFCALEQGTVLKLDASYGLDISAAPLLQAGVWSTPSTQATPQVSRAAYREPLLGLSVAIRFLRLTI